MVAGIIAALVAWSIQYMFFCHVRKHFRRLEAKLAQLDEEMRKQGY